MLSNAKKQKQYIYVDVTENTIKIIRMMLDSAFYQIQAKMYQK